MLCRNYNPVLRMGLEKKGWGASLRVVSAAPDEHVLFEASEGFFEHCRSRSAKRVLTWTQGVVLVVLFSAAGWALFTHRCAVWSAAHIIGFGLFAIAILWRLLAAASLAPVRSRLFVPGRDEIWPIYTILCPLHREAGVVFDLVAALNRLDYPKHALDIQLLVEGDDVETIAAALAAANGPHIDVVIIPPASPRTKPKALNVGLARARGDYITVFDAEDRPHPTQLRAALAAFADGDARLACLQAPLVIDNARASWIARQFAAEYAIQFREILPLLARLKLPLPLGGTSNHFRVDALRAVRGWDPYNVTEDADLGYRLARDGYTMGVIAPPTWEEAPITLSAWLKQRTRWIKGHLQTWLALMRNPVRTAQEMGFDAFASMQLVLGGGIAASLLHAPLIGLLLYDAVTHANILGPADVMLALCGYVVAVFAALTASALSGDLSHARAAFTMPLYWPLATVAAVGAVFGLIFRPHHWAKTAHGVSARARMPAFDQPARTFEISAQSASTSASG
ncbi:MAG: glycosyltransferase [Alphaproteobacteria bacterium]